ncbi:homoserine dehydrogenase [Longimicrobium sp.]|uniref:homoserine dehydrogenase n=1 Tax=Longimicrobium sp. TaxID=2029185 RepID=UPI002E317CE1|nr:homoserine dehydrogenase [Longimicrobium sp.]HEX6040805.1 homoserine dehydrogenase [Longimicrobium sp.]
MSTALKIESETVRVPAVVRGARTVRVALAGCGTVGGELVRMLHHGAAETRARHGLRFELVRVLVAHGERPRPDELDRARLTTDLDAFLAAAAEADVVVEAIGGIEPALSIARAALARGKRLVTANKALVAAHGPELAALARRHGGRLDFESAAAGGIPVVRALRESLSLTGIRSVRGILNGTTNYILSRLEDGWTFADALADAQARGFAEADPSRDLSGEDAADKLRILAWLAFGTEPARLDVRRRGLKQGADRLARAARALGGAVRFVAEAARVPEGIVASVEPVLVAAGGDLGRTRDEENLVIVESEWNGRIRLGGPGAGGGPTASALLGDLVRPAQRHRAPRRAAAPAVPDRRAHAWAIAVERGTSAEEALRATLDRVEVDVDRIVRGEGVSVKRTRPVAWPRIGLALRALEVQGLSPGILRVEG